MCRAQYCNKAPSHRKKGFCDQCYTYFVLKGKDIYHRPENGRIAYTPEGEVVCHICGQAHSKLGNHIYYVHGISVNQYKEYFKLPKRCKLTSRQYQNKMIKYNQQHKEQVVDDNLIKKGKTTRFYKGQVFTNKQKNHAKKYTVQ